jgi:hypothetical protein
MISLKNVSKLNFSLLNLRNDDVTDRAACIIAYRPYFICYVFNLDLEHYYNSLIAVSMDERAFEAHVNFTYIVLVVVFRRRHASLISATSRELCISLSICWARRSKAPRCWKHMWI